MLKPGETKSVYIESPFKMIGNVDGQSNFNQTSTSIPGFPGPDSSLVFYLVSETETTQTFIRHRNNKQIGVPVTVTEMRLKAESESESEPTTTKTKTTTAAKIPREYKLKGEDLDGKNNVEKEMKKLKAKVESLMKFKARVQGRQVQSDDSDAEYEDEDEDVDERKTDRIADAKKDNVKNQRGALKLKKQEEGTRRIKGKTEYEQWMIDSVKVIVKIQALLTALLIVLIIYAFRNEKAKG